MNYNYKTGSLWSAFMFVRSIRFHFFVATLSSHGIAQKCNTSNSHIITYQILKEFQFVFFISSTQMFFIFRVRMDSNAIGLSSIDTEMDN